jgi:hypothetical protein
LNEGGKVASLAAAGSDAAEAGSRRRIHLKVRLGSHTLTALVDTGATLTAIAANRFAQLSKVCIIRRVTGGVTSVTSAGNDEMKTRGTFVLEILVDQLGTVRWPVTVIENLSSEMIIGDDFLQHFRAKINVKEKSVQLRNPVALNTLTCREKTVIPPFTRRPVTAGHNGPAISNIGVVIPKYGMFLKGIQEWDSDRATVKLHAINASAEEIVIQRGEELGSFLQVKPEDTGTLEAFKACRPAATRKSILTPEKDKMIREEARVQIQDAKFKEGLTRILRKYHDIISETTGDLGRTNAVPHKLIPRSDRQIYRKQFPIPEAHVPFVNKTVDELLRIGAIEPDLASHHNTPIFCVKKPHSTELRLVQDLRMVNDNVEDFFHPILDVQSCMAKLGGMGARYFAALDLTSGFYQLELDKESRPLTAFTVPGRGRFAWTVSTMGLKTSPGAFSRLMEHVMQPVKRSVTYMDDVILAGETPAALLETVEEALQQLQKYNLKLNLRKCIFGAEEVDYLGYRINRHGMRPGSEKTEAIKQFPEPQTQQDIRRFVGMANYFRGHIPHFAQIAKHLTRLTCRNSPWTGGPLPGEAKEAFGKLREALASAPVTALPRPDLPYTLETDASTEGLGACLTQIQDGKVRVIGYASKGLEEHERNYSAFLLEHRAAVFGIEHFRHLLTGVRFDLIMDHKPLIPLNTVHKKTLSRLQQLMSEFTFQLRYRPGSANKIADALSRAPVEAIADSHTQLEQLQRGDDLCRAVFHALENGVPPGNLSEDQKAVVTRCTKAAILKDSCVYIRWTDSAKQERELLLTPKACRYELVRAAHASRFAGHGGEAKTLDRLRLRYFWPSMAKDVMQFIKSCRICQESKSPPNFQANRAPLQPLEVPDAPNYRVHMDLFSVPRRSNDGNKHVLVITDAFSKWVELVACPDKEAKTIASGFFNRWVCRYSVPRQIVTDRGREFCNQLVEELTTLLGTAHKRTSAYHPQTNTSAESFNRTLIKILATTMDSPDGDWEALLPIVALTYNTRVHASTKASPFFLTFLRDPNMPHFDLEEEERPLYGDSWATDAFSRMRAIHRCAKENAEAAQRRGEKWYNERSAAERLSRFKVGDPVYVYFPPATFQNVQNKKLVRPWKLHRVTREITPTTYMVKAEGRRQQSIVHVNRMKPCYERRDGEECEEEESETGPRGEQGREQDEGQTDADEGNGAELEVAIDQPVADERQANEQPQLEEDEVVAQAPQEEVVGPRTRQQVRGNNLQVQLTPPRRPLEYRPYPRRRRQ